MKQKSYLEPLLTVHVIFQDANI